MTTYYAQEALAEQPAQQEPTCKQDLQVWVQRTGQFSWEPQDERFWTRMQPAQRTWVGLTDEERYLNDGRTEEEIEYARAIEAKLKEKNT